MTLLTVVVDYLSLIMGGISTSDSSLGRAIQFAKYAVARLDFGLTKCAETTLQVWNSFLTSRAVRLRRHLL